MNRNELLKVAELTERWFELEIVSLESVRETVSQLSTMAGNHDFAQHIQNSILNRYIEKPLFTENHLNSLFTLFSDIDDEIAVTTLSGMLEHSQLSLQNLDFFIEKGIDEKYNLSRKIARRRFSIRLNDFDGEMRCIANGGDAISQMVLLEFLNTSVKELSSQLMTNGSNKKIRNLSKDIYLRLKTKS